jgi:hypothetical protein
VVRLRNVTGSSEKLLAALSDKTDTEDDAGFDPLFQPATPVQTMNTLLTIATALVLLRAPVAPETVSFPTNITIGFIRGTVRQQFGLIALTMAEGDLKQQGVIPLDTKIT